MTEKREEIKEADSFSPTCLVVFAHCFRTTQAFRDSLEARLTCRIEDKENCVGKMDAFLSKCFYCQGGYDSEEGFDRLNTKLCEHETTCVNTPFPTLSPTSLPSLSFSMSEVRRPGRSRKKRPNDGKIGVETDRAFCVCVCVCVCV